MAPSASAPRQGGPQPVPPYTYPQGTHEGMYDIVSRHGHWISVPPQDADLQLPHEHVFQPSDGGVLPTSDLQRTLSIPMFGRHEVGEGVTVYLRRPHGNTGAYDGIHEVLPDPPEAPRPHTIAQ